MRQKRKRIKYRRNKSKRKSKEPAVSLPLPIFCNRREIFSSFVSRPWMQSRWKIYKQGSRGGRFLFFLPLSLSLSRFFVETTSHDVIPWELWEMNYGRRGRRLGGTKWCPERNVKLSISCSNHFFSLPFLIIRVEKFLRRLSLIASLPFLLVNNSNPPSLFAFRFFPTRSDGESY